MRLYFNCIFYKISHELGNKVIYFLFVSVTNEDNVFSLISLVFMMHGIQEPPAHCTTAPLTLTGRKAVGKKKKKQLLNSVSKVANITCRHDRNSSFEQDITIFQMTAIAYMKWLKVSINVTDISYLQLILTVALVRAKKIFFKSCMEGGWSEQLCQCFSFRHIWVQAQVLISYCVALGKFMNLPKLYFPCT